eukprot:CAMPEP_0175763244 /NCGR_PEP_ID=MMETSP0097-20121207/67643_1 /TAXON_ID=311494 /ORGANISM="Alexandrium monilatum, Strain CCMP3105" /LENGTH=95 /DNA_ID=CAMNT_0017072979 /DNA_START=24 /DNA_END=307 /DNA_ORIENTATION=+
MKEPLGTEARGCPVGPALVATVPVHHHVLPVGAATPHRGAVGRRHAEWWKPPGAGPGAAGKGLHVSWDHCCGRACCWGRGGGPVSGTGRGRKHRR